MLASALGIQHFNDQFTRTRMLYMLLFICCRDEAGATATTTPSKE